jgi:hypothetical protein
MIDGISESLFRDAVLGLQTRCRGPLELGLFTVVRGETVWKTAEGLSTALLWRQEALDQDYFNPRWPLSGPRFGTHPDFPNSFGRGFLRSSP